MPRRHVYNVRAGDLDGLTEALHLASTTPIDKFLLPEMRLDNVRDVMHDFLETDRRLLAEEQRRVRELEGSETIKVRLASSFLRRIGFADPLPLVEQDWIM